MKKKKMNIYNDNKIFIKILKFLLRLICILFLGSMLDETVWMESAENYLENSNINSEESWVDWFNRNKVPILIIAAIIVVINVYLNGDTPDSPTISPQLIITEKVTTNFTLIFGMMDTIKDTLPSLEYNHILNLLTRIESGEEMDFTKEEFVEYVFSDQFLNQCTNIESYKYCISFLINKVYKT